MSSPGVDAVLDAALDARRAADREEARLLALAVHWVDLHPVTDQDFDNADDDQLARLGGVGTPGIAEFAVEELVAALGLSYHAGMRLVTEAVELCFRLPRLWSLVQDGRLQAWKARQVAAETTGLSRAAVGFVDRHAATTGTRNRIPPIRRWCTRRCVSATRTKHSVWNRPRWMPAGCGSTTAPPPPPPT
jgi:hypothetical protein